MVSSWIEDSRRKRMKQMSTDLLAGSNTMLGGVDAFDEHQRADAKLQADAAQQSTTNRRADVMQADNLATNALRRKADDAQLADGAQKAAADDEWKALRKKGEADEQGRKVLMQKRADALGAARAGMQRGLSQAELDALAKAAGVTPEQLLMQADTAQTGENQASALSAATIADKKASATKKLMPKPGPSPAAIDRQKKKDELLDLTIDEKKKKGVPDGTDLRKEFNALPAVKQYNEVRTSFAKMEQAVRDPSAAGDIALIFSFMKMLDPTSTVREGEFASAQNAAGVPDQVRNAFNRAANGERLNTEQRSSFLAQGNAYLSAHKKMFDEETRRYGSLADKKGVAGQDVTGVASGDDEFDAFMGAP